MAQYSLDQIREFWTKQANKHGRSFGASWSDQFAIELEIRTILDYLNDGDRVLDAGCANGFSTLQFASQKKIEAKGLDCIAEMIEEARKSLDEFAPRLAGKATFAVGDITALKEQSGTYDKVVVIRVVINLGGWEHQVKALKECARVLKSGGLLLLSEATLQGWRKMNQFRAEWGLPVIPMPPFNLYLDEDAVVRVAKPELELVELVNFSSTYFVGTRVIKPLLSQSLGGRVDPANPSMEWNRWFSQLPAAGDYGTQKLFVFRRKPIVNCS